MFDMAFKFSKISEKKIFKKNLKVTSYMRLQGINPATSVKLGKICQTCFFPCKSMKSGKFLFQFLVTFKIALAASTFWQNNTVKTRLPQKIYVAGSIHINNFTNFTGKQLRWSLFSIKFQAFRPAFFLKTDSNAGIILWMLWNF